MEASLGLLLVQASDGRVQVASVKRGGAAWSRGVPPLVYVESVNGESASPAKVEDVQRQIRAAARPVVIAFDRGEAYAGLAPDEIVEKAAGSSGFETARVTISKPDAADLGRACAFASREGDVVEVEYTATLRQTGAVFDSTAARGRPFAALLGNGDLLKGLELGLLEMCIGERRTIEVPAALGFGARGSRAYGVPPDAALTYDARLVSINGVTNPSTRREDVPDEQRYF